MAAARKHYAVKGSLSYAETHQTKQPVCIEDKVCLVGVDVSDDGVHASYLVVAGDDLQVMEDSAQVRLL